MEINAEEDLIPNKIIETMKKNKKTFKENNFEHHGK